MSLARSKSLTATQAWQRALSLLREGARMAAGSD